MENELISLLERYIKENKLLKEEFGKCKTMEALYKELINVLNEEDLLDKKMFVPILLDTIYGDDIYINEFYTILLVPDKEFRLKKFIDKITSEYEKVKEERRKIGERIFRNKELVSSSYRVRGALKYHKRITDDKSDIRNVKKIINYYEVSGVISNKEEMLLINEIELHNSRVAAKRYDDVLYVEGIYNELPNILNIGFQEHDQIEIDLERKTTIDKLAKELRNTIDYIDLDEIVSTIEMYKKYNLDSDEYKYLILKIMDYYFDELITLYDLLMEKEIYTHKKDRVELIKNYYYVLEKYLIVNNYYNDVIKEEDDTFIVEEIDTDIDLEQKNQLIYARSDINVSKSRIISDMSDVPYEYYNTVYDLIDRFKSGKLSKKEIKTLSSSRKIKGHIELKYDQVRIILKHIKDNIYCVLGVFVKKADNDVDSYKSIVSRKIPIIRNDEDMLRQIELSEYTEKELEELVTNEARKGTR